MKLNPREFLKTVVARHPSEAEFHQAVEEVVHSVAPYIAEHPKYLRARI